MTGTPIEVAYPVTEDLHLRIALAACRFKAEPGEGEAWITGTCHDPTAKRLPRIVEEGGTVRISEVGPSFEHIPAVLGGVPRYELAFGKKRPFALTIETGASEFELDLGGVPVSSLVVRQGAGKFELDFSAPNPQAMKLIEVSSGAADIELENLANANFSEMRFSGGAAGYELDFGGTLLRDAEAKIEAGLSGVDIKIPASTAAKIVAETTLGSVDTEDGFTKRKGALWTEAGMTGKAALDDPCRREAGLPAARGDVNLNRDQRYPRCFHTGLWTKRQEIDADEFNGVSNLHHGRSDQDDVRIHEANQAAPAFPSAMTITTSSSTTSMTFTPTPTVGLLPLLGMGRWLRVRLERDGQSYDCLDYQAHDTS